MARWRMARDHVIAPAPTDEEVGDTRGLMARMLTPEKGPKTVDDALHRASLDGGGPVKLDPEVEKDYKDALKLYKDGRLAEAEQIFARLDKQKNRGAAPPFLGNIGRKQQDDSAGWTNSLGRDLGTPWRRTSSGLGEDVLFLLAETQFRQGKLVAANDSYNKLAATYTGTKYLGEIAAREYQIADLWLKAVDPDSPPKYREKPGDRLNGYLPLIDVTNNALSVLEHVRQHKVDGPFADDAVMRIADFHFKAGNFDEASVYYDQLIEDETQSHSPLLLDAHVRSIDSKIKAYVGPEYDSAGLESAVKLIRKTMTAFPERDEATDKFLMNALYHITDQQAEITFRRGEFYRKTGYPGAAEFCYAEVRSRWPQSEWAAKSQEQLAVVAKAPRREVLPSKIMTAPGAPDPVAAANAGMGGMGGIGGMNGMTGMGGMGGASTPY
jgi:TolA-binding protein